MPETKYLTLDEIHEELLALLLRFDSICKSHGLRYSLDSGTLLGAIRHKGFIPWDDDIDVSMPRPDYEKLLSISEELPEGFRIDGAWNSRFAYPFAKFCTESVRAQEPSYQGKMAEYLWVDIFPIDGAPLSKLELARSKRIASVAIKRSVWSSANHSNEHGFKKATKMICSPFLRLSDQRSRMLKIIDSLAQYPGYENAERVTCFAETVVEPWSLIKASYEDMAEVEFEGHLLPAMGCWDEFLTTLYGEEYMKLPPEDKRQTHHVKAWRV